MDLEEDVAARLRACEHVVALDTLDLEARERREMLAAQVARIREHQAQWAAEQVAQARTLLQNGARGEARKVVHTVVNTYPDSCEAWLLLAELSVGLDERVQALEEAARCNPDDPYVRTLLARWRFLQTHPLKLAEAYEEEGLWERALEIYRRQAVRIRTPAEWGRVYRHLLRLEKKRLSAEQASGWMGSTWTAALISVCGYLLLVGLLWNAGISFSRLQIWGGVMCVSLGVGLLGGVRSRSRVWQVVFQRHGERRYAPGRVAQAVAAWFLWMFPFGMLLWRAFRRFGR